MSEVEIRPATVEDAPLILGFIRELAEYERLSHEVVATEKVLRDSLFGERRVAEALIGYTGDDPAGFALFFHSFSTFLGRPGIYLEDLYVRPAFRGAGIGRALLFHLARLARERGRGRLEWSVLDCNEPAIGFYREYGRLPGERVDGVSSDRRGPGKAKPRRLTSAASQARTRRSVPRSAAPDRLRCPSDDGDRW